MYTSFAESRIHLLNSDQKRALRKFVTFCAKTARNLPQHADLAVEATVCGMRRLVGKFATAVVRNG